MGRECSVPLHLGESLSLAYCGDVSGLEKWKKTLSAVGRIKQEGS